MVLYWICDYRGRDSSSRSAIAQTGTKIVDQDGVSLKQHSNDVFQR